MEAAWSLFSLHPWTETAAWLAILAAVSAFVNFVVKRALVEASSRILAGLNGAAREFGGSSVIPRLANAGPALVVSAWIMSVPGLPESAALVVRNVSNAFIILCVAMAGAAGADLFDRLWHRKAGPTGRSVRGYVQVGKILLYGIAAILMVAAVLDRSPMILLSGLGAMAAVLILVFQDTLLSLVAGIQISSTDMVRVGDWIEMPSQNADGDVIEIALHTVKVQNWDKTVTTIPIRKLVTDSFKNWRGMQESGGRRIKRAIFLDQTSIRFLKQDDYEKLASFGHLETYLEKKRAELAEWNAKLGERANVPANTRRSTNIGTLRAYLENYLRSHPGIHQAMTIMVRQLPPGPEGLPLEIYCFTNTTAWAAYEGIQADIFDHILSILPEFDLRVFQNPSGQDIRELSRPALGKVDTT